MTAAWGLKWIQNRTEPNSLPVESPLPNMSSSGLSISYCTPNLAFHFPFTISGGRTKTHQPSLLVRLTFEGLRGFGEAPAIAYYNIPVEKMIQDLESIRSDLEGLSIIESSGVLLRPEAFWSFCHSRLKNSFLLCALDMAYWDLFAKRQNLPLHAVWGLEWPCDLLCDYTIGLSSIPEMVEKIRQKPWPLYKVKVGTDKDRENLTALRAETQAPFRVDANGGWTAAEAIEIFPSLKALGVEFVEQPLHKDDWAGMKELRNSPACVLPLIADESCVHEEDVKKCAGFFDGVNIKLTKCGGPTPALRMIKEARELGMSVMMGCMNESSIGCAAIANFLPVLDFVDMDGPLLLSEDTAEGIFYQQGKIRLNGESGLGITVKQEYRGE